MKDVISKDSTIIAFDKSGQGPAVILVDGALCYRAFGPTLAYDNAVMDDGSLPVEATKAATMPTLLLDGSDSPAFFHEAA